MNDARDEKVFSPGQDHPFQKTFIGASSALTGRFPRLGAKLLDGICYPAIGNPLLSALGHRLDRRIMGAVRSFRRFLVLPDIHIGDAVMTQAAITALRDFFPAAEIDYVVNRTAFPLIEGNPEATRVIPLFASRDFISEDDLLTLRDLTHRGGYDLCWNFGPFIKNRTIASGAMKILNFTNRSPEILMNERRPDRVNHFIHHHYWFVRELLTPVVPPLRNDRFDGVRLALRASAGEAARRFVTETGLSNGRPLVLLNPDGASPYTRVPFATLTVLFSRLAELDAAILLNSGHTVAGIGQRLLASLTPELRRRAKVIPAGIPLEVYAGIVDLCDVFISGDSGPLHIAAARRDSPAGGPGYRNRTAVMAFFGGTPSRMSGYDSSQPGFLPANQDAPSWTFTAGSPCRNITCLNKMLKTCPTVRCFEDLDVSGVIERVRARLAEARSLPPVHSTP